MKLTRRGLFKRLGLAAAAVGLAPLVAKLPLGVAKQATTDLTLTLDGYAEHYVNPAMNQLIAAEAFGKEAHAMLENNLVGQKIRREYRQEFKRGA